MEAGQSIYFPSGWHHAVLNLEQTVFTSAFHQTTNIYPDKNTLIKRLEVGRYTYYPPSNAPVSDFDGKKGGGGGENAGSEWSRSPRDNGGVVLKTLLKLFPNAFEASM